MEAAQLGRNRKYPLRKDWEAVKDTVMYKAVYAKFSQNNDIKLTLLTTKDEELIENTSSDYYWGCGSDGTGKNILGKILMKVRSEMEREFLNNGDELDEL